MKRTISKIIGGFMLTATFTLLITSCQKEQNTSLKSSLNDVAQNKTNSGGLNENPEFSTCAPIPEILKVEEGNKLVLQTFARGVQIYEVQRSATDPTRFSWVNIAPLATLYTRPDFINPVIEHFAGPSWQFIKGPERSEKVVAARVQGVTMDQTAIQWLLLKAVNDRSTPDNKITFIHRICTQGGLAPTSVVDESHLGQRDSIPYTASYLFYEKN